MPTRRNRDHRTSPASAVPKASIQASKACTVCVSMPRRCAWFCAHSLIPAIARAPSNVLIRHLESGVDRNDQPLVRLTVQLRDFAEAQRFFLCLPKNRVAIEDYGRDEGQGDPEPADRFLFE